MIIAAAPLLLSRKRIASRSQRAATKSCPLHQLCNPTRDLPIVILLLEKPIASVPILSPPRGWQAAPLRVWSVCEGSGVRSSSPPCSACAAAGSGVSSCRSRPRISAPRWIGGGSRGRHRKKKNTNPAWNAFGDWGLVAGCLD